MLALIGLIGWSFFGLSLAGFVVCVAITVILAS